MNVTHLKISQAMILAIIHQIGAIVVAFGIIDNQTAGVVITASVGVVNAAFLIANAIHAHAAAGVKAAAAQTAPPRIVSVGGGSIASGPTPPPTGGTAA